MEYKLVVQERSQVLLVPHTPQFDLAHAKVGPHMVHLILNHSAKHRICIQIQHDHMEETGGKGAGLGGRGGGGRGGGQRASNKCTAAKQHQIGDWQLRPMQRIPVQRITVQSFVQLLTYKVLFLLEMLVYVYDATVATKQQMMKLLIPSIACSS